MTLKQDRKIFGKIHMEMYMEKGLKYSVTNKKPKTKVLLLQNVKHGQNNFTQTFCKNSKQVLGSQAS